MHLGHAGVQRHPDVRRLLYLGYQVLRHGGAQASAADQQRHLGGEAREVHGRLARGVAGAHHDGLPVLHLQRFREGGAVVEAAARQALGARHVQPAVAHARGHQHRAPARLAPVGQLHHGVTRLAPQPHGLAGGEDLRPEAARLRGRPPAEVRTAESRGEAQVVLDAGALARLPAGSLALHQQGAEALRGAVHPGRQPRRAGAHDHQVVELQLRGGAQADVTGDVRGAGLQQRGTVGQQHHRQVAGRGAGQPQELGGLRRHLHVEPAVRHHVAAEELLERVRGGGVGVPYDRQRGAGGLELGMPVIQQVGDDGVEPLLRRIPRFHEVVVELRLVDGLDGRRRVRVGGEQHALGARVELAGAAQELQARHARHALVHQEEGHRVVRQLGLLQQLQRGFARVGPQDAVARAVLAPQVARHGAQHSRVVVHRQDDRFLGVLARHHSAPEPGAP